VDPGCFSKFRFCTGSNFKRLVAQPGVESSMLIDNNFGVGLQVLRQTINNQDGGSIDQ
jgi:hypothetical protein